MARASTDVQFPVRRRNSIEWLPPLMSELRLVLLGNSWSERSSVGNLILGKTEFNTKKEPDKCLRVRGRVKEKDIVLINTPDLIRPFISEEKLTEHVTDCMRLSDPGPHVFLLVLAPEDFQFVHKVKLCKVLKHFSDQSFDHSLILILSPRRHGSSVLKKYLPIGTLTRQCRNRYLEQADLELSELLTCLGQIVKENNGEHVICHLLMDPTPHIQTIQQEETRPGVRHAVSPASLCASGDGVTPPPGETRILLLGKNEAKLIKFGEFITQKEQQLSHHSPKLLTGKQKVETGWWRGKPLKVLKPADVFVLPVEAVRTEVKSCVSLCPPGPNVLLLLVKPSEFTEENRQTLKIILSLFGPDAFKHSMVISTHKDGQTDDSFRRLLRDCGERHYSMSEDNHRSLMTQIESLVNENRGAFLTLTEELMTLKPEKMKPALNLVLCGRRGAGKSSAAEAILGQTGLHSASTSSECVQHQGEVCGRRVSLVDLPALSGKPLETVMEESLRSVSLCDPEGVHAFILVLPVSPLTDEDKGELKIIQETFSSQVNDFTMILFITESEPTDSAVGNFLKRNKVIRDLVHSCGGRHFALNINKEHQIPELLNMVEKMRLRVNKNKPCSFSTETFELAQTDKISSQQTEFKALKTRCPTSCEEVKKSSERLRIVLIGKTGNGKSSSGNTILGRKEFVAKPNQTSVTRDCQKAHGEVDGRPVAVVDTPGLFDDSFSHKKINEEMIKCFSLLAPGPHVFLLVLHIGRFTKEEKNTIKLIREGFGKDAEKFTIILLTGGDTLEYEKCSIEEYVKSGCDKSFKKLISDCGGRYHVLNNRDEGNREQVSELMAKIDTLVKTNGGCYFTNTMLQEAEAAIKKETERLMKEKGEEMRKGGQKLPGKHEDEEEMKEMEERRKKQREDFEREREKEQVQENEQIRYEEQTKLKKLQEKTERENDGKRREEENRIRKKEEEKEKKAMEDAFKTEMENMKKKYEEEARKKAEECNEFKEKYAALKMENEKLKKKQGGGCTIL